MAIPERLGKLTAKTVGYNEWTEGGFVGLSPEDLIGAMKGLHGGPYYIILAKYLDDTQAHINLKNELLIKTKLKFYTSNILHRPDIISNLAATAVYDVVPEHNCPTCKNGWVIPVDNRGLATSVGHGCSVCNGTGKKRFNQTDIQKLASINAKEYKVFVGLYSIFIKKLIDWESAGICHIKKIIEKW